MLCLRPCNLKCVGMNLPLVLKCKEIGAWIGSLMVLFLLVFITDHPSSSITISTDHIVESDYHRYINCSKAFERNGLVDSSCLIDKDIFCRLG